MGSLNLACTGTLRSAVVRLILDRIARLQSSAGSATPVGLLACGPSHEVIRRESWRRRHGQGDLSFLPRTLRTLQTPGTSAPGLATTDNGHRRHRWLLFFFNVGMRASELNCLGVSIVIITSPLCVCFLTDSDAQIFYFGAARTQAIERPSIHSAQIRLLCSHPRSPAQGAKCRGSRAWRHPHRDLIEDQSAERALSKRLLIRGAVEALSAADERRRAATATAATGGHYRH
ncbi:hypothetical protein BP5796_12891 [Coleophoma crateriformis]|uniref:Uncharacterized protein n=1 Tax=Coleophoma crateriformis TaxID=565419 RepID=A0A3D8Q5Y6_9HELO|nr:hypothetical protein BP5796_12891 [Coleophoma crateriformis]